MTQSAASAPEVSSLEQARGVINSLFGELQQALWEIKQLKKELYGPSSERQVQDNLSNEQALFSLFPAPAEPAATAEVVLPVEPNAPERVRRQPAARVLETVTERLEPQEKVCAHCGKDKCEIGCEKSERFEYVPAKIVRHEIIRPKLACPCGQSGVSIAPLPPSVIPQGQPGPALVAHVTLTKFMDHVPLHRQQQQFARLGVNFPKSTLGDWVEKGAAWLEPIVREMKRELLKGDYAQVDETPVRVQDPDVEGKCATGWLWVLSRPGSDVVFEFHPGRGKEFAQELLGDFKGYLQRDGYGVYGSMAKDNRGIIPVGCWAHARRKFIDAVDEPGQENQAVIEELRKLYVIERHARDKCLGPEERKVLRQEISLPILRALRPRLEAMKQKCLPKSPSGKAARVLFGRMGGLEPLPGRRPAGDRQ